MATLSANSRRNSSSSTFTNSPRPSIGNGGAVIEPMKPSMQPVHEEESVVETIPLLPPPDVHVTTTAQIDSNSQLHKIVDTGGISYGYEEKCGKETKEKICTERSDNGFSECSNASIDYIANNRTSSDVTATHPLFDKINSILEEKLTNEQGQYDNSKNNMEDFGGSVSVNMLKLKLEKIAKARQECKTVEQSNKKLVNKLPVKSTSLVETMKFEKDTAPQKLNKSYSLDSNDVNLLRQCGDQPKSLPIELTKKTLMRSSSLHRKRAVEKGPIMRSDFTNTVKMRKKSLESSASREKQLHSQRITLEQSGKVSKLLRRFDSQNTSNEDNVPNEPIVQSPDIDDFSKEIQNDDIDKIKALKHNNEVVEILNTPMVVAQKKSPIIRKLPTKMNKMTVSRESMKRTIEYTNTKTCVTNMEVKVSSYRPSPNKLANIQIAPVSHVPAKNIPIITKKSNSLKKIPKSTAPDTSSAVQRASHKTSTYSKFNQTSPVRLSGRVKQVTDRLSVPKAVILEPSSAKDYLIIRSPVKNTLGNSLSHQHHHQMSMSGTIKQHIVTVSEAVIETKHQIEHSISGKIDGTFTFKNKINENFQKASAFWKAT